MDILDTIRFGIPSVSLGIFRFPKRLETFGRGLSQRVTVVTRLLCIRKETCLLYITCLFWIFQTFPFCATAVFVHILHLLSPYA
jgi:hypothetical protein